MKLGILGGTFDPPHVGHLAAGRSARDSLELDRVLFTPTFVPPHKPDRPSSSPFHRYAMTVLATLDEEGFSASSKELVRGGLSYTIDTLREERASLPDSRIFFILGTDQLAEIASWHEAPALLEEFELIVVGRPGMDFEQAVATLPGYVADALREGRILRARGETIDVSATTIRSRVCSGQPVADLVCPRVARYIEKYGLYCQGG